VAPATKSVTVTPARRVAHDILLRVETGSFASNLLASIPDSELSAADRSLAQELVLGVLRWRKLLDYFLERYARRALGSLDPPVLIALRMGLYQLRQLSRVPAPAAVSESVNLVKRARLASAAPFVNAVLRKAARNPNDTIGNDLDDPMERLAVEVSHPSWMIGRWSRSLRNLDAARALALANNQAAPPAFRVNTIKTEVDKVLGALKEQGCVTRPSGLAPGALVAEARSGRTLIDASRKGLVYIQSEASQLVSVLLAAEVGQTILDLCAAPGSKATHIAALTSNHSPIVACDIHPSRLKALSQICRTLGVTSVQPLAADMSQGLPFANDFHKFDRVLIDAPCSGTGTLRENPEIKWRLAPGDITRLAELQYSLLTAGASAVRPGGRLVYSTCSMEPEENEEVVNRFLASGAPFKLVHAQTLLFEVPLTERGHSDVPAIGQWTGLNHPSVDADANSEPLEEPLITESGFVRTFPHLHNTDGFFAAVLVRD